MDDSSLPPVKRRPVPVPPPPPDAGALAGPSVSPAEGAPPVAASEGLPGVVTRQVEVPPLGPPIGAAAGGTAVASRRAAAFPAWGWALLGFAGVLAAAAVWVMLVYGPWAAGRSTAADDQGKTAAKTAKTRELTIDEMDDLNVERPRQKPAAKKTAAAKTAEAKTSAASVAAAKPDPSKPPGPPELPKPKVAASLEDAKEAIVRFENPGFGGQREPAGLGFLIDGRGWIAANLAAVADATTGTRAVLANGVSCELAGFVARDPKCGLAILKLRERPLQITVLDMAAEGPRADDRLFFAGHPFNADFALAPATVAAVLTSTDLPPGVRQAAGGQDAPRDASWIQLTAKTSAAAAGGPLLDARGHVLGINRAGTPRDDRGYALHVRHLRALAETASEDVAPLPPGEPDDPLAARPPRPRPREPELPNPPAVEPEPEPGPAPAEPDERVQLSRPRMKELYEKAAAAGFKPQGAADYAPLASLARLMTLAKSQKDQAGPRINLLPQDIQDALQYADELAETVGKTEFDAEQVRAVNRFAAAQLERPNAGAMLFATVLQSVRDAEGKDAIIAELSGTQKLVGVFLPAGAPQPPRGTRLLVLGIVSGSAVGQEEGTGEKKPIVILRSFHLLRVK